MIVNDATEMCFVDGYPHWAQMRDEEEKLCRLAAEKIAKAAKSNGSSANTQSSVVKRRIRVLVVEYSESLRKEWSTLVEGFGHEPIACEIGGEAFAKVRQSQSDLERDPGAEQIDMILLRASARQQLDQIRSYHYRGRGWFSDWLCGVPSSQYITLYLACSSSGSLTFYLSSTQLFI